MNRYDWQTEIQFRALNHEMVISIENGNMCLRSAREYLYAQQIMSIYATCIKELSFSSSHSLFSFDDGSRENENIFHVRWMRSTFESQILSVQFRETETKQDNCRSETGTRIRNTKNCRNSTADNMSFRRESGRESSVAFRTLIIITLEGRRQRRTKDDADDACACCCSNIFWFRPIFPFHFLTRARTHLISWIARNQTHSMLLVQHLENIF